MKRLLILLSLLAATALFSAEIRPYRFMHADSLVVKKLNEEYVTHLYGDVHFFYGETEFFADRAELYDQQKIARLVGKVKVYDDTLDLFADSVSYSRQIERLDLVGNVFAERDTVTLSARQAVYFRERQLLQLDGEVYYHESHADSTIRTLSCHHADYTREPETLVATGRVRAWDEREDFYGRCGRAEYHIADGYAWMTESPEVERRGEDSLYISAERIEYHETAGRLTANFNVVTRSDDYNTTSDFLIYLIDNEEAIFLGEPSFYSEQAVGTAEEFHLYFEEQQISHATFKDSCEVRFSANDSEEMNNSVISDWMEFEFAEGKLRGFTAEGQVESFFEQLKDGERDYAGNNAKGQRMRVTLDDDDKISAITMSGGVSGKYKFENKQD